MSINLYRSAAVSLQPEDVLFIRNQVFSPVTNAQNEDVDMLAKSCTRTTGLANENKLQANFSDDENAENNAKSELMKTTSAPSANPDMSCTRTTGRTEAEITSGPKERTWPDVGTELTANYYGVEYGAKMIPATKKLKSGKQIQISTGAAAGRICDSMSEAMLITTANQRAEKNLRRKGVANGWDFWQWGGK
jgi:hypothetical protein